MICRLKLLCSVEKWRTYSQNQRRVILNMLYERCLNNCWKPCLVLFFHRSSMSTLIFQQIFVATTNFVAQVADASIWIGGVMVIKIVEMDPTRKIAVVRILFIFPFFGMFILCLYEIYMINTLSVMKPDWLAYTFSSCHDVLPTVSDCKKLQWVNYIITTIKKRCLPLGLHGLYGEI